MLRGITKSAWGYHRRLLRHVTTPIKSARASTMTLIDLSGIYPPIATPFNADESIAWDKLEQNFSKWNQAPLRGYVVQGSNGEYTFLTPAERVDMVKRVVDLAGKNKLIIAGSGCESTSATISMSQQMAEAGAQALLVVTPCYFKNQMTNQALIAHYTKVADESSVPILLYSVPANTGIDLAPEVIVKLSSHPNIIGYKDSGGDITKIGSVVYQTRQNNFQVLAGSASFLLPAFTVGCVGGVCALANILPKQVCDLEKLYKEGKMEEAKNLQHRLIGPNTAVTKVFGVPGLKKAMDLFGLYGGPTRSPLLPLTTEDEVRLRKPYLDSGFLT